jgi:hypothetical protein
VRALRRAAAEARVSVTTSQYERLYVECRKRGLRVILFVEPPCDRKHEDEQPRIRIGVVNNDGDIVDESAWVEAGSALNRAAVGTLTRLAGLGLI